VAPDARCRRRCVHAACCATGGRPLASARPLSAGDNPKNSAKFLSEGELRPSRQERSGQSINGQGRRRAAPRWDPPQRVGSSHAPLRWRETDSNSRSLVCETGEIRGEPGPFRLHELRLVRAAIRRKSASLSICRRWHEAANLSREQAGEFDRRRVLILRADDLQAHR
jgi:hypothetical protein